MDNDIKRAKKLESQKRYRDKKRAEKLKSKNEEDGIIEPVEIPDDDENEIIEYDDENVEDDNNKELSEAEQKLEDIRNKKIQALAKAREKRKPPTQIRKEYDDEIQKMREENLKLKTLLEEREKQSKQQPRIIKKVVKQKQIEEPDDIEYLSEKSYAQRLRKQLQHDMISKVMKDTFG